MQHPEESITSSFLTPLPIHRLRTSLSPSLQPHLLGFLLGSLVCHCLPVSYVLVQISQTIYKQYYVTNTFTAQEFPCPNVPLPTKTEPQHSCVIGHCTVLSPFLTAQNTCYACTLAINFTHISFLNFCLYF